MYAYVREGERETHTHTHKRNEQQKIRAKKIYITKEMNLLVTKWEEGALYIHPLSSLTTKAQESWGMWKLISYVS